jgi:hypothetical protein
VTGPEHSSPTVSMPQFGRFHHVYHGQTSPGTSSRSSRLARVATLECDERGTRVKEEASLSLSNFLLSCRGRFSSPSSRRIIVGQGCLACRWPGSITHSQRNTPMSNPVKRRETTPISPEVD